MERARQLAILGMVVSGLLAILKITVGWFAHSAAVSADGFESAADVFTSGLVLVGLTLAARPAGDNHPYGHGRERGSCSLVADAANDGIDMLSGLVALGALSLPLFNPTRFLRADHYGA